MRSTSAALRRDVDLDPLGHRGDRRCALGHRRRHRAHDPAHRLTAVAIDLATRCDRLPSPTSCSAAADSTSSRVTVPVPPGGSHPGEIDPELLGQSPHRWLGPHRARGGPAAGEPRLCRAAHLEAPVTYRLHGLTGRASLWALGAVRARGADPPSASCRRLGDAVADEQWTAPLSRCSRVPSAGVTSAGVASAGVASGDVAVVTASAPASAAIVTRGAPTGSRSPAAACSAMTVPA